MKFYLGTHQINWLRLPEFAGVPLFVSDVRLRTRKAPLRAATRWALDSGGFTQLSKDAGGWPPGSEEPYVARVLRYREAGGLDFASQQDWMCEPWLLHGRTVREHQERTVANYLRLCELAPGVPWLPVLQGWEPDDYHACADLFESAGVRLADAPRVGVGSVCRRQATDAIGAIARDLSARGYALHGFGVKSLGLRKYAPSLASADSMAWSFRARWSEPLPGCAHGATGSSPCSNCPRYALAYRARLLASIG